MTKLSLKKTGLKLALLFLLALPELADAQQFFNYNQFGDVLLGFRKTGSFAATNELVVDLGSITNLLKLPAGTVTNIINFSPTQLTAAFSSGFGNLQWSVSAAFPGSISPWVTPLGSFPKDTIWYTLPATSVAVQTQPPLRDSFTAQASTKNEINGIGAGALAIAQFLTTTNSNNNLVLVREPVSFSSDILTAFIGDVNNTALGDFGANGTPLAFSVENTTPNSFTTSQRDDLYQLCPYNLVDPITGLTNQTASYFVGYFILTSSGTMTFTRATAASVPSAGSITSTVTNGFSPLTVIFTNSASGSITNWVWNFGNGTIITNTTGGPVTNTFTAGGSFTVILTVSGAGGSSSVTNTAFIVASPQPSIKVALVNGKFLIFGTNCPSGVQYRILSFTNLLQPINLWKPVVTNFFLSNTSFSYTNSTTNAASFYRLVSP
jgi:PKD repeat protein